MAIKDTAFYRNNRAILVDFSAGEIRACSHKLVKDFVFLRS
jgi:hypothetical protein